MRSSQGSTTPQKLVAVDQEEPTLYTLNRFVWFRFFYTIYHDIAKPYLKYRIDIRNAMSPSPSWMV